MSNQEALNFDKIVLENVTTGKVESKNSVKNKEITYRVVPIKYNYGSKDKPALGKLRFETPEVTSNGIIQAENKFGQVDPTTGKKPLEWSLMMRFDLNNQKHTDFVAFCDNLYLHIGNAMEEHADALGITDKFQKNKPKSFDFKPIIYRPVDKTSKKVIAGGTPSCFVKLNNRSESNRTLFVGPDGVKIDWKYLYGVEITYSVVWSVEQLVFDPKVSLRIVPESIIVTGIRKAHNETTQVNKIKTLTSNTSLMEEWKKRFSEIVDSGTPKNEDKKEEKSTANKIPSDKSAFTGSTATSAATTAVNNKPPSPKQGGATITFDLDGSLDAVLKGGK